MKTFSLLFFFLLIISCNTSTKKGANEVLEQTEVEVIPEVASKKLTENTVTKDTLSNPEKKEPTTPPSAKEIVEVPKKETIVTQKTVNKSKPETIEQKTVIDKNTATKKVPVIEKEQIIAKPTHEIWDKLTKTYVSSTGKVNYSGFKSQIAVINDYLLYLQNTPPTKDWSKNEKLAYWFNLYNASTVHLVATNYPVKSIKDINGGKPWDKKFIKSGTNLYSLNDIENKLVRPNFNEPRLHVAFNCAAISCPSLLNAAFTPTKLNSQLNSLSKKWINDSSKNKITADEIQISQIFDWYKTDFKTGVITFINTHSTAVKANSDAKITFMEYNWSLNE